MNSNNYKPVHLSSPARRAARPPLSLFRRDRAADARAAAIARAAVIEVLG